MSIEILTPTSRDHWLSLRGETIGASEVAALLGVHPYTTPYELFAIKTGMYKRDVAGTRIEGNSIFLPPMERGNFLEEKAFELAQMMKPDWAITPNQIPSGNMFRDLDTGISSTPDAFIVDPDRLGRGTLQVKNIEPSIFRKSWKNEDGEIEPPLWIAVQAMVDAMLSGCTWCAVGVMVIGFEVEFHIFEIPMMPELWMKIVDVVEDFWHRVKDNNPYQADYGRDGAVIAGLYQDDNGAMVDLSADNRLPSLLGRRDELKEIEKAGSDATKERKAIDTEIIEKLGHASTGFLSDGRIVEAKTIRRAGYEVQASSYRTVKIKKGK